MGALEDDNLAPLLGESSGDGLAVRLDRLDRHAGEARHLRRVRSQHQRRPQARQQLALFGQGVESVGVDHRGTSDLAHKVADHAAGRVLAPQARPDDAGVGGPTVAQQRLQPGMT